MEMKLTKSQRLIAHATADKDFRDVLKCIHFRNGMIEATNGFALVQKDAPDCKEDMLLESAPIAKMKDWKSLGAVWLRNDDGNEVKLIGEPETTILKQKGDYPKTDALYPTTKPVFQITLAKNVLVDMLKCMKINSTICFTFYGKNSTVKFEVTNDDEHTRGLIMPVHTV